MTDKQTFEQCVDRIRAIQEKLASSDTELEESIALYREATGLLTKATGILNDAKAEIAVITAGNGAPND